MKEFMGAGMRVRPIGESTTHFIREDGMKLRKMVAGNFKHILGYIHGSGYRVLSTGGCTSEAAHRVVAKAFIPNPDNLPMVDHRDNDRLNNNVSNLRWCTNKENMKFYYNEQKGQKPQTTDVTTLLKAELARKDKVITLLTEELNKLKASKVVKPKTLRKPTSTDIPIIVDGVSFTSCGKAATYIVDKESIIGVNRRQTTISRELRRHVSNNMNSRLMYNTYTIGY